MKTIIQIILVLFITGCVPQSTKFVRINTPTDGSYEDVLDVLLTEDDFKKTISYKGTLIGGGNFGNIMQTLSGSDGTTSFLRATHSLKTQLTTYQLYVSITYTGDWVFYDHAYDENGLKMDTIQIARDVIDCEGSAYWGCKHREDIAVNLEREYMEQYAETGVKIQISSSAVDKDTVVELPSDYIKGFLASVPVSGVPAQIGTR